MPIHFTSERWPIIEADQEQWHFLLLYFVSTARWTHWHKNLVLWHNRIYNCYHAHFRFCDPFLSPVGQFEEHLPLDGWPANHIPFFVPVHNPHIETWRNVNIGCVVLICKENIECFRFPRPAAAA